VAAPQFKKSDSKPAAKPVKRKNNLSPEAREKLSRLAKERVEKGIIGGAKFGKLGGRPRKPRASAEAAEEARKHAQEIIAVFKDGIDPERPMGTRLKAAELWLAVEEKEAKLSLAEERQDEQLDRDEIIKRLADGLLKGAVGAAMQGHINGTATDITDAEIVDADDGPAGELEAA
jgi:hypothetical protein